jgi:hypothetical protein
MMAAMRTGNRPHATASVVALLGALLLASCALRCGKEGGAIDAPAAAAAPRNAVTCVDGRRALAHIERLVALGPRHAGAPGAESSRELILDTLRGFGLEPKRHDFTALTPHPQLPRVPMANITVDLPGPGKRKVLLGGHFDGKIIDGVEFRGANDGGSSTGLLLEMARCLVEHPPPAPVRIAFFDGEEALVDWSDSDSLYGSKNLAAELKASGEHEQFAAAVVVDMIGDKRLKVFRERLSTPWVFQTLERTARRLGHGELLTGPRAAIEDDHVPFQRIGIPAAVLIDLKFGPGWDSNAYWHTAEDTIDKVSADSMTAIGRIVLGSLAELAAGAPTGE